MITVITKPYTRWPWRLGFLDLLCPVGQWPGSHFHTALATVTARKRGHYVPDVLQHTAMARTGTRAAISITTGLCPFARLPFERTLSRYLLLLQPVSRKRQQQNDEKP